ncbi:MAG: 2OG-Fe(II) oxygenase [Pseudomonadota bacterium]
MPRSTSSSSVSPPAALASLSKRVRQLSWTQLETDLNHQGFAQIKGFFDKREASQIKRRYDDPARRFRKTVNMHQHQFGAGEYKYFANPLPAEVAQLRRAFYKQLAPLANQWSAWLKQDLHWPQTLSAFTRQCHAAGQSRPTPLLLHYKTGGFNRLHQDMYGEVFFPFQVVFLLDQPQTDFTGGEFLLVENSPRRQARSHVIPLALGDALIFPVRERPEPGKHRMRRCQMRHGVSTVHSGTRTTLGLIFHDA